MSDAEVLTIFLMIFGVFFCVGPTFAFAYAAGVIAHDLWVMR